MWCLKKRREGGGERTVINLAIRGFMNYKAKARKTTRHKTRRYETRKDKKMPFVTVDGICNSGWHL